MTHNENRAVEPTMSDSIWAQIGGEETFERLVRSFYARVQQDPVLSPMYPVDDWEGAILRLRMFLEQYWGGPTTYSDTRGHPRLRMRHAAFTIDHDARERWLSHMLTAVDELDLPPMQDEALREYFDRAALSLVNHLSR